MPYWLTKVTTDGEWHDYHALRRSVLWEDRGDFTYNDQHPDEYLPSNHPLLLIWGARPIGTTRLDVLANAP